MTRYKAIIAPLSSNPVTVHLPLNTGWEQSDLVAFDTVWHKSAPIIQGAFKVHSIVKHGNETTYNLMPMP